MSDRVALVRPRKIATYRAAQWIEDSSAIEQMAAEYGWRVSSDKKGRLWVFNRRGKGSVVRPGHWVVALGNSGAVRVCSDRQFQEDYEEIK